MNSRNRVLLQNWRANVDIQLLFDWEDAVRYIIKYVFKQEKRTQPILDLFKSTVCQDDYDKTVGTETGLRKVFLKAVGGRDITAQETSRLLLGGKCSSSTFNYKRLNVDPDQQSRAICLRNGTDHDGSVAGGGQRALGMTSLERYAGRVSSLSDYPDVMTLSAYEFTRAFKTINGKLHREPSPADIIVIKLPVIGATKGSRNYSLRCRNNLVAHRPWNGRVEDAWRDKDWDDDLTYHDYGEVDDTSLRWVTLWESYLRVHSHFIPDVDRGERLQDRRSDKRRELLPDEDDPENLHRDRGDDWMDAAAMAGVVGAREYDVDETWDIDHDCTAARTHFIPEDIASGSTFINVHRQQVAGGPPDNRGVPVVLPSQLNQR